MLAQGQLESALDACQQALTFDENHVGALRLEEEIETALRRQTKAQPGTATAVPSANVETLWADLDARPSEVITRLDQVAPMGIPPAPSGGVDRTVVRLPTRHRRTPRSLHRRAELRPGTGSGRACGTCSARGCAPVAQPPASQPVAKSSCSKGVEAPAAKKAPSIGPMVADIVARCKTIVAAAGSVAAAVPRDRRTLSIVGGVIAVIVATVVGFTMFSGPVPTAVVIDATPWGTITAIETEWHCRVVARFGIDAARPHASGGDVSGGRRGPGTGIANAADHRAGGGEWLGCGAARSFP